MFFLRGRHRPQGVLEYLYYSNISLLELSINSFVTAYFFFFWWMVRKNSLETVVVESFRKEGLNPVALLGRVPITIGPSSAVVCCFFYKHTLLAFMLYPPLPPHT